MPEHFEVKRICSYLKNGNILGKKITDILFLKGYEKLLKRGEKNDWIYWLKGQQILEICVKGKYTFFQLTSGTLTVHYRFTGIPHISNKSYSGMLYTIFNLPTTDDAMRFCRFKLILDHSISLSYCDIRCLSDIVFYPQQNFAKLNKYISLAPDLSNYQSEPYQSWIQRNKRRKRTIKQDLQDQYTSPSGIGNYLACEILFLAKLCPWTIVSKITEKQYQCLCLAIQKVINLCRLNAHYSWFGVFNQKFCSVCRGKICKKKTPQNPFKSNNTLLS